MQTTTPELSVIILCYRSEEEIIEFAQKVKTIAKPLTNNLEIVLVGNYIEGSSDKTKDIVEQIAKSDPIFKTICKPKKGMMGWDMREGLAIANGDFLCVIDGDGQFPVESISQCFHIIKSGNYDLVKTYRIKRGDGFKRNLVSWVYNRAFKILFPNVNSKDVNSKPKLFTRQAYEKMQLTSDDWFIDAEIMIKASRLGMLHHEFPIEFSELIGRASFVKPSAILEFIKNLIRYRFKKE